MARFLVLPGSVAVASDRLVQILGLNVDGSIEARDLANGSTFNCDPSLLKAAPRARHGQAGAAQRIDVAVDNDWETARQREAVLRTISEQGNLSRQVADAAANLGVSVRTVFRWLAAYRQLPQTSSLLPNPMGPPKGTKRIDAKVEEVIESVINDVYLSKPRAKKEEVARMVGLRCEAMGLKAPSRKPILARLSALDKSVVAKARLEPGEAAALVDFVPGTYKVVKPLDVVQIDHTLADVIVPRVSSWVFMFHSKHRHQRPWRCALHRRFCPKSSGSGKGNSTVSGRYGVCPRRYMRITVLILRPPHFGAVVMNMGSNSFFGPLPIRTTGGTSSV